MDVFDVPGEEAVEQSIEDHHQQNQLQTVLIILDRRHGHVVPLDSDSFDFVERKVLRAEAERRR